MRVLNERDAYLEFLFFRDQASGIRANEGLSFEGAAELLLYFPGKVSPYGVLIREKQHGLHR